MKTLTGKFGLGAVTVALTLWLPFFASDNVFAQDGDAATRDVQSNEQAPARPNADLIGRLNLTPDQIKQIREIRQQNAVTMQVSRQRLGRAQLELDEAIYADDVDEALIEARARDVAAAQAAVARLRALTELRIRRVLTSEQLNVLREIRRAARQDNRERRRDLRQNPSAFQQRRRTAVPGSNQNDVKPGDSTAPQSPPKPPNRRP